MSNPYDPLPDAPKDFTLKEALKPTVTSDGHFHCGKLDFPDSATFEDFKTSQQDLGGTKEQLATLHFVETTGKPPNTQPMNPPPKGTTADDLLDITTKEPQKDGFYHLGTLRVKPEEYTQFKDLQKTMCAKNPEALAALYHMENQPNDKPPVTYRMTKDDDRHARYDSKSNTIFVNSHSAGRDEGSGVVLPPATAGMHEEAHWASRAIGDTLMRIPDKDHTEFADRGVIEGAEARDLTSRGLSPRHGHNTLMVPVQGLESTQATLTIKQDGGQRESRSPFQQSGRVMDVKDGWVKLAVRGDGAKPEHQMEFKLDQVATAMGQDSGNARRLLERREGPQGYDNVPDYQRRPRDLFQSRARAAHPRSSGRESAFPRADDADAAAGRRAVAAAAVADGRARPIVVQPADLIERVRAAQERAAKLIIYRLPPDLLALAPIAPGMIASFPGVATEQIDDRATIDAALVAVVASAPRPVDGFLDTRFGLEFSDLSGEPVLNVYKGAFVSRGQIDEQLCVYDGPALYEWLRNRYPA